MDVLKLENVEYSYNGGKQVFKESLNYSFEKGKIYAIVGKSGSGKTTLLSLLSGLTDPTKGDIYYLDNNIKKIDKWEYRSHYVGVIFQSFNLLPQLSAKENVELSLDITKKEMVNKEQRAKEVLLSMDLDEDEIERRVLKLSGGQQQRVAIARALSYEPDIILADEPTGNLDLATQDEIMNIFTNLAKQDKCVIIVTHSPDVAKKADIVYSLGKYK